MPDSPYPAMPEPERPIEDSSDAEPDGQARYEELMAELGPYGPRAALRGAFGPAVAALSWLGLWAVAMLVLVIVVAVIA